MVQTHGWEALTGLEFRSWGMAGNQASLLVRLFKLAPVILHSGIYGAARAIRLALIAMKITRPKRWADRLGDRLGRGGPAPGVWPVVPAARSDFFLLVPLDLLAAVTVAGPGQPPACRFAP